jgi:hypothetical protein
MQSRTKLTAPAKAQASHAARAKSGDLLRIAVRSGKGIDKGSDRNGRGRPGLEY